MTNTDRLQHHLADILAVHRHSPELDGWVSCACDGNSGRYDVVSYEKHVAAAIAETLQLQQESGHTDWSTATGTPCTCDVGTDVVDEFHLCERGKHGDESFPVTRWVSPWRPADEVH